MADYLASIFGTEKDKLAYINVFIYLSVFSCVELTVPFITKLVPVVMVTSVPAYIINQLSVR